MKNFLQERNPGIIVLGYIFLILLLYLSCHFLFKVPLPTSENLYRWDTGWYLSILENGYEFNPNSQSNSAFFPLFPFFWKFLGVDAFWISTINGSIFLLSFYMLSRVFQFKNWQSLLFISAPSLFFCFVAYSEALFFLTSTILLIGYKLPRRSLTAAGIFFSSMARSASMLFLPAILLSEVPMMKRLNGKSGLGNLMIFVGAALVGMAAVMFIQYLDTGKWFVLFEVMKQWDRNLKIPLLPYWTWGAPNYIWLDGYSFFICVMAVVFTFYLFICWIKNKWRLPESIDKPLLFSLGYLVMMTVSTIFFAPQSEDGTSMMSLNRYVLATPFFMIFFFYYFEEWKWTTYTIISASVILAVYPLLIGLYQTLEGKVFFASSTFDGFKSYLIILVIILLYASLKSPKYWLWKFSILFLAQIAAQIFLYNRFLSGHWVG